MILKNIIIVRHSDMISFLRKIIFKRSTPVLWSLKTEMLSVTSDLVRSCRRNCGSVDMFSYNILYYFVIINVKCYYLFIIIVTATQCTDKQTSRTRLLLLSDCPHYQRNKERHLLICQKFWNKVCSLYIFNFVLVTYTVLLLYRSLVGHYGGRVVVEVYCVVQFREPAQSLPSDKPLIKRNHCKRSKFSYHHCVIIKKRKKKPKHWLVSEYPLITAMLNAKIQFFIMHSCSKCLK